MAQVKIVGKHVVCDGGEVFEDESMTYPYENEDGTTTYHPALRCAKCGKLISGDPELEDPYTKS